MPGILYDMRRIITRFSARRKVTYATTATCRAYYYDADAQLRCRLFDKAQGCYYISYAAHVTGFSARY